MASAEMRNAIAPGFVIGDPLVSYWPIVSLSLGQPQKSSRNLTRPSSLLVSKVTNRDSKKVY